MRTPLKSALAKGDQRRVGGEELRPLHIFEGSCLIACLVPFCDEWVCPGLPKPERVQDRCEFNRKEKS